jgi:hypothetical protein
MSALKNIEAMKQALEALEGLINRTSGQAIYSFMETERRIGISACVGLRQAIAEAEKQEPDLTELGRNRSAVLGNNVEAMMEAGLPFLTALQTTLKVYDHAQPTPPQLQPLTDEQRDEIARQADENDWHDYDLIDAVEAAHGIKGEA